MPAYKIIIKCTTFGTLPFVTNKRAKHDKFKENIFLHPPSLLIR